MESNVFFPEHGGISNDIAFNFEEEGAAFADSVAEAKTTVELDTVTVHAAGIVIAGGNTAATENVVLGRLTPEELEPLTRQASVGLVMLEDIGLSYHFALPNRIGDFVAAGVPMVVSNLPEMAAAVRRFGVGVVMRGAGARYLAEAVKGVLSKEWKEDDFAEAREDMDWNKEKLKLIKIIDKI